MTRETEAAWLELSTRCRRDRAVENVRLENWWLLVERRRRDEKHNKLLIARDFLLGGFTFWNVKSFCWCIHIIIICGWRKCGWFAMQGTRRRRAPHKSIRAPVAVVGFAYFSLIPCHKCPAFPACLSLLAFSLPVTAVLFGRVWICTHSFD